MGLDVKSLPEHLQKAIQEADKKQYAARNNRIKTNPSDTKKKSPKIVLAKGKITQPYAGMNKWESAYAQHLEARKLNGEIVSYTYESIKFKLADLTYYTPDFFILFPDGSVELHEVKGFWRDDARVKIKVVAKTFPMFTFIIVTKDSGAWIWTKVS